MGHEEDAHYLDRTAMTVDFSFPNYSIQSVTYSSFPNDFGLRVELSKQRGAKVRPSA